MNPVVFMSINGGTQNKFPGLSRAKVLIGRGVSELQKVLLQ